RQDANNKIKKLEKDKEISGDESKKAQEQIQKITDEAIKKIDESVKNKEDAILKV
ncbi:ribosome recycling factor, partial [Helicobacter pylori]|uniref:ribosome recycling factor n=1 Tax=Helicobacter pylori TaxID=210 RepID=UPI0004CE2DC3